MITTLLAVFLALAPAPDSLQFLNLTFGEPASALIAREGDPLLAHSTLYNGESVGELLFFAPSGKAVEYVRIARGDVIGVRLQSAPGLKLPGAMPSALGVTLGGPASQLSALAHTTITQRARTPHGMLTVYRSGSLLYAFLVDANVVTQFDVHLSEDAAAKLPRSPEPTVHSGLTPADAVVIKADTEDLGNEKIGVFLSANDCGDGGNWKSIEYGIATAYNARPMAKVNAACTVGGQKQTFYFDIKSFFGHGE